MIKLIALSSILFIAACSDAEKARTSRAGKPMIIKCYSGSSAPVFEDESTGIVRETEKGAGLYYLSAKTQKYTQIYMDCVVIEK